MTDAIWAAAIAAGPATITGLAALWQAALANKNASEANQAVNQREPGEPKLKDDVRLIRDAVIAQSAESERQRDVLNQVVATQRHLCYALDVEPPYLSQN